MANYSTTANVILSVNGKQAQQVLRNLEKDAKRLEREIAKAAKAGDKATMKKLQRELKSTNTLIKQMQGSAKSAENVLKRLDKATPKELKTTLRTLQQQLNGIERGSKAWTQHVAKIKAVKTELTKLNASLATNKSLWEKMNTWLNNCQTALLGISAVITGLVMAGRKAVNMYAEIEEELANTRKYTGLTVDEVKELNDAFKSMDTRTSRAELNELAQEAGRLGLNTLEAVQGYVEAADIINVALVDLGEGATQTIAKLTNIFGVEDLLGIKEAMLAVGSTVNVLSQNCTASKPYLVEFAQRMAGIGSQAGLTIPQILAFGAVLDANGQKVEMSATAIQKVIMNLANKNKDFAATLGLDAELLNKTLKNSAKDGLLMFLQALHDIGEASDYDNATMILAPAFKDMGLDAARVSQVLSTLANHIDEVKEQLENADIAFNEASSATKEYGIFNNTAQASIEKAKKRVSELAVELGEKLFPVMRHIYTSSSLFLRVLNILVDFFIEHKRAIASLVVSIIAYKVAINASNIALNLHYAWLVVTQKGMALVQGAGILLKAAFYALTGQITKAKNAFAAFNLLTKTNHWAIIISAIAAAVVWLVKFKKEVSATALAEQTLSDISKDATEKLADEKLKIELLVKAAKNEKLSLDERRAAVEKLNKIIPNYNAQLDATTGKYTASKKALDKYINSLRTLYEVEGAKETLKNYGKRKAEIEAERFEISEEREVNNQIINNASTYHPGSNISTTGTAPASGGSAASIMGASQRNAQLDASERKLDNELAKINKVEDAIFNKYGTAMQSKEVSATIDDDYSGTTAKYTGGSTSGSTKTGTGGKDNSETDRFAQEKDWREREEAKARISYATGETDYIEYTNRMDEIAVEFYEKQLKHTDLTETEKLTITADWREAQKQQAEDASAESVELEKQKYNDQMAIAKQFFIDGLYNKDTYTEAVERLDIRHQQNLLKIYTKGSKEYVKAEESLSDLLITQKKRRQEKLEELEKKYAKMKEEYFGDNPQEAQAKYDADLAILDIVYQRELTAAANNAAEKLRIEEAYQKAKLALQKKYGLLSEDATLNSMQKGVKDSLEWLDGDGGKALTGSIDTLVSGMSSIFSQLSTIVQAEMEMETAAINKRFDAEVSRAEGNSYQVKMLEEQKEKEIAKVKKDANRKMFAMQVIQAVAQTAQGAISAYSSAAAVPVTGWILAPIAAGMALAAGAIQIAAIKKQQQASETQGYSEGGFTPDGDKDKPVGIVHAGEWVASQKLTCNPKTRPLLEALDQAQRNNTIGSITAADVSRSITAPIALASAPAISTPPVVNVNVPSSDSNQSKLIDTLSRLNARLNEPFGAVVTVTGDQGIARAQDEYDNLIRNKSPKSKK